MIAEKPAEGILKRSDYGNSKWYQVVCGCGQDHHDHTVEVEADETGVTVNIYATPKTDYWTETFKKRYDIDSIYWQEVDWFWKDVINGLITRLKVTWEIWTTGTVTTQTTIAMSKQQALNYANTLNSAVVDVEIFENQRKAMSDPKNKVAKRLADENDCI
jgi:hypothetical protein